MTPSDVTTRVTTAACVLGVVLAIPAGWFGGPTVALGVLAGGALAVANFRSLATRAIAVVSGAGGARAAWPRRAPPPPHPVAGGGGAAPPPRTGPPPPPAGRRGGVSPRG